METFAALRALCEGNSPVTGEFPSQRPVTQSFDVFFDLRLNKSLALSCFASQKKLFNLLFNASKWMKSLYKMNFPHYGVVVLLDAPYGAISVALKSQLKPSRTWILYGKMWCSVCLQCTSLSDMLIRKGNLISQEPWQWCPLRNCTPLVPGIYSHDFKDL